MAENDVSGRYDLPLMAAYVRGCLGDDPSPLVRRPLDGLTDADCGALLALARERGLDLHHFKRFDELPRVRKVLGFLQAVRPESLLDVGSGRGVFLFPFLRGFPDVPVTSLDLLERRVEMLQAVRRGGMDRLDARQGDICRWDMPDGSFDVVTLLEVLEHIPDTAAAVRNACRLARRYVVVTVPSKPDNNPEHIHLLTKPLLTRYFEDAGMRGLRFDGVPGHLFMTARKEQSV